MQTRTFAEALEQEVPILVEDGGGIGRARVRRSWSTWRGFDATSGGIPMPHCRGADGPSAKAEVAVRKLRSVWDENPRLGNAQTGIMNIETRHFRLKFGETNPPPSTHFVPRTGLMRLWRVSAGIVVRVSGGPLCRIQIPARDFHHGCLRAQRNCREIAAPAG